MDSKLAIGFLLGLLTPVIVEKIKKDMEVTSLIDIFRADFKQSWRHISSAKNIPDKDVFSASTLIYKDIDDLNLDMVDSYLVLPVHNFNLYESEGKNLAKYLKKDGREQLWYILCLSQDIEQLRVKLLNNEFGELDREYRKVFRAMVTKLYENLDKFQSELPKSYPLVVRVIRHFQS
ncbi:hypothetical protein OMR72_004773 [Vibrio parahaemolyticus]|uniref:hypothetical protein n=2 Tax=Vibrio parahaemolyticus TaxID=670 RepID=UPI00111D9B8B|nr:hypothetical protein [Vibrio parahaemolyticus]EHU4945751.1 hypothetical protein [Vibrio vulnificus]EIA3186904.1 hypothetical protein [Vibrio parahaemolyticus]EIJ2226011.1 hypothetical protein [Vibrio parahaemolyticus]EJG1014328.1 hypothetical protein [Vibrio parahaemolyticus]EJG1843302.1 hypothetical protein [Vibrio parahaemolyticus]